MDYLNYLYIALTIFITVIGVLLALILFKVNKILGTITKVTDATEKVLIAVNAYKQIPDAVKQKLKNFIKRKK